MKRTIDRLSLFYILASLPLLLIAYLRLVWPFAVLVPVYGFIILLLKKDALSVRGSSSNFEKALGVLVAVSSFFVYYILILFFESLVFYGAVNYAVYIFGMFLAFFGFSALREVLSPVFLMVAASSTGIVSLWLEHYSGWYIPLYLSMIVVTLNLLGIGATHHSNVVVLQTPQGPLSLGFVWACAGVNSMLIFLIILVVTLFEESASPKTKLLWGIFGILGTFLANVIRLVIIFLADYFYGSDVGGWLHYFIGYVLFILWLLIFFFIFSKRQQLSDKISSIWQKLSLAPSAEKTEAD